MDPVATDKRRSTTGRVAVAAVAALLLGACTISPSELTTEENEARVSEDVAALFNTQEPLTGPVTLEIAIARAIKYNFDQRLRMMETALARKDVDMRRVDLAPEAAAQAGYNVRDNFSGAASQSLITGVQSLESSTSAERTRQQSDVGFSWNILDFGLSYVRARQQSNRVLIAEERRRKVIHNLIQDVRSAFWRAVSAEQLISRIDPLMIRVMAARQDAERIEQLRLQDPLVALNYQRTLLDTLRQLKVIRRDLVLAKTELAGLMGYEPSRPYQVEIPADGYAMPTVQINLPDMERMALMNRPELLEEAYQGRIARDEVYHAILKALPGIELTTFHNYDSNLFLFEDNWTTLTGFLTYNVLDLITTPFRLARAETLEEVSHARRLALSIAVVSQVHLSVIRLKQAESEFETADELSGVDYRILDQLQAQAATQAGAELEVIRGELNAVISQLRKDIAYAEVQNAVGRISVSVGADPLPAAVSSADVEGLAVAVRERLDAWHNGDFRGQMLADAEREMIDGPTLEPETPSAKAVADGDQAPMPAAAASPAPGIVPVAASADPNPQERQAGASMMRSMLQDAPEPTAAAPAPAAAPAAAFAAPASETEALPSARNSADPWADSLRQQAVLR